MIEKLCEVYGCNGSMVGTGANMIKGTNTLYRHCCNECGAHENLEECFPIVKFKIIDGMSHNATIHATEFINKKLN